MRNTLLIGISLFIAFAGNSQGLINNGARIVMNGATSNIYINGVNGNYLSLNNGRIDPLVNGPTITLLGNWTNNSGNAGFGFNGSRVVFAGGNQSINGTSTTQFYDVTLLGTGTKTLNCFTVVGGFGPTTNGVLDLGARPLNLNGFDLWVYNATAGAITSTTGYIQSETNVALNPSRVRWFIATTTGARVIPFGVAGTQIPFTVNTTTAMPSASSNFLVSTRATAVSANTPWASTVTHMYSPNLGQDGSDEAVIDRWWEITYSDAATATMTFSYRGVENTMQVPYNTGNIGAQWWAAAWLPNNANVGSAPAVTAGVGSVTATGLTFAANAYMPMILSSLSAPLPIELVSFKSNCENDKQKLHWLTASEMNNDFFTIERSEDGINFRDIGTVNGNGTTTHVHQYSFIDPQPVLSTSYYRLRQTDYNGQTSASSIIVAEACGTNTEFTDAFSTEGGITILLNNSAGSTYKAELFDAQGRLIVAQNFESGIGANRFALNNNFPATGIYMLMLTGNNGKVFSKKLYVVVE